MISREEVESARVWASADDTNWRLCKTIVALCDFWLAHEAERAKLLALWQAIEEHERTSCNYEAVEAALYALPPAPPEPDAAHRSTRSPEPDGELHPNADVASQPAHQSTPALPDVQPYILNDGERWGAGYGTVTPATDKIDEILP